MARVEIPFVVEKIISVSGQNVAQPVSGASVQVNLRSGGSAVVYQAETGGSTLANPLTSDASGRIEGWVDEQSYDLIVSGAGITTYTQRWEATRGDVALSIPGSRVQDGTVTASKLSSALMQQLLPTGTVLPYAAATPPSGFLVANGQTVSRTTYVNLWNALGTTSSPWGQGDGSTTFNVPDLRGRMPIGLGTHTEVAILGNSDGASVGSRKAKHQHGKGTLNIASSGAHTHRIAGGPNDTDGTVKITAGFASFFNTEAGDGSHVHSNADFAGAVGDTAGPTDSSGFVVVQFIIKT